MSTVLIDQTDCLNCGTPLLGAFCGSCGQKVGAPNTTGSRSVTGNHLWLRPARNSAVCSVKIRGPSPSALYSAAGRSEPEWWAFRRQSARVYLPVPGAFVFYIADMSTFVAFDGAVLRRGAVLH